MICVKSLNLGLNRVLLLTVGLWPYERSKFAQLQLILFYSIVVTFIMFQCTTLFISNHTAQSSIEILSNITFFLGFPINYNMFCFNIDAMKHLLDILQQTYDELRDESEVAIIKKYGIIARRFTGFLTLFAVCVIIITLPVLWLQIVGIALPANKSRRNPTTLIETEYFADREKYLIMLHTYAAFCIGIGIMLATGTMIITYFQYACGMFKIARFMNLLMSKVNIPYLGFAMIGIICLSLNLFREMSVGYNIKNLIVPITFSITNYIHIYLANGCSQQVMDCSNNVYSTVYNVQWYLTPLCIQKMMLFLLQRGSKAFVLSVGGMFVGSLENAAKMTSYSVTYFTVLYSMH